MKKPDIYLAILFTLLVTFSFLSFPIYEVAGQTDTSSSSGDVTSSSTSSTSSSGGTGIVLNSAFTGHWKARVEKPIASTSSPGGTTTSSGEVATSSTSSSSGEAATSSTTSSTSSNGTPTRTTLAHIDAGFAGSRIITFKLCVKDGKLEGLVHQGGVFLTGKITSQTIISENEVEFTAESKDGKTAMIHLKLTGSRQFIGTFADGHTFEGRKLNENRSCLAPGKGTGNGKPDKGPGGAGRPSGTMSGPALGGSSSPGGPKGPDMGMFGGDDIGEFSGSGGPSTSGPGMGVGVGGMNFPGMGMSGREDLGERLYPTTDPSGLDDSAGLRHGKEGKKPKKPKKPKAMSGRERF